MDTQRNHKATKPAFNVGPSSVRQGNSGDLTHLSGVDLPSLIGRMSLFQTLRVFGVIFFIFFSNFIKHYVSKTVETLIRRRILQCLVWVCTVLSMSHKTDAMLKWVNLFYWPKLHPSFCLLWRTNKDKHAISYLFFV